MGYRGLSQDEGQGLKIRFYKYSQGISGSILLRPQLNEYSELRFLGSAQAVGTTKMSLISSDTFQENGISGLWLLQRQYYWSIIT